MIKYCQTEECVYILSTTTKKELFISIEEDLKKKKILSLCATNLTKF